MELAVAHSNGGDVGEHVGVSKGAGDLSEEIGHGLGVRDFSGDRQSLDGRVDGVDLGLVGHQLFVVGADEHDALGPGLCDGRHDAVAANATARTRDDDDLSGQGEGGLGGVNGRVDVLVRVLGELEAGDEDVDGEGAGIHIGGEAWGVDRLGGRGLDEADGECKAGEMVLKSED